MSDILYDSWYAMSDKALLQYIGSFIKATRLAQNKTQQQVADAAGIVRSTLVQMENGKRGAMKSFIQVMRTLEQLHHLKTFEVTEQISPLLLAKQNQEKRQRARKKNDVQENKTKSDW